MRLPLLLALSLAASAADGPQPVLVNGDFEQVDAQGALLGWEAPSGAVTEVQEGNRVLVLKAEQGNAAIRQVLRLDPSWGTLRIRYRAKVDAITPGALGWHNARFVLNFLDAKGTPTGRVAGDWKQPTAGWIQVRQRVEIPAGAVQVTLAPSIFEASGSWALDDLTVELLARRGEGVDAELPIGEALTWGQEPVEAQGPQRAEVCLNGLWRFLPANGPAASAPVATGWGWLRVPGGWRGHGLPGVTRGDGPAWSGFGSESPAGWYERDLAIPAGWTGRTVVLDLRRVSTDASVQIDGKEAGAVAWPGGEVDLTGKVEAGRTHRLRIKVVAVADQAEVTRFMGTGEGQVLKEKFTLPTRGLIGDVLLASRPRGAGLTGCAISTTVKPGKPPQTQVVGDSLAIAIDYQGLPAAGELAITATVRSQTGTVKRFAATAQAAAGSGTVQAAWKWENPALWDIGKPSLYDLELGVKGAGLEDSLRETFGFREFRIEDRRFLLNGTEIRLRPAPVHANGQIAGVRELMGDALDGLRWAGFNTHEIWPDDFGARGSSEFNDLWCAEADRRGFLIIAPARWMTNLSNDWGKPGVADGWNALMVPELKRLRNHPSVVMWVCGTNRFGHGQDQNPQAIGHRERAWLADPGWRRTAECGADVIRRIKAADPTRPVMMHAGGAVGDVYTANNYLCLTPLQEREEWLSRWAKDGDMPVLMVEFGTPLYTTFHRGRRGYNQANSSEPLYSEHIAAYLGIDAYRLESPAYRNLVASSYDKDQLWKSWHGVEVQRIHEGFNRLQAMFQTNTWRTWRTWGITGGLLPWGNGHGWNKQADKPVDDPLTPFAPGLRGAWRKEAPRSLTRYFQPEGMPLSVAGKALVAANQETLAWIAGAPDFVDKTHHVRTGTTLAKQVAILNDGRTTARWTLTWSAELGGARIASGTANGLLAPAGTVFAPINADIPASLAAERTAGVVRMTCTIGNARHEDAFPFTAFRSVRPVRAVETAVLDPVGDTTKLLAFLGVSAVPWDGAASERLVVIGRNAFAKGGDPATLEQHLRAGGRVLVMAQDPAWLAERFGLRVSRNLARRAFPVITGHPALAGFDAEAFRDWAGDSRLLPPTDAPYSDPRTPAFGWRWGARHAASSAAIEIPHRAGWRPILACEFDGAYTPLAEVAVAGGMVTVCTLDLEDHAAADPAAERVARTIIVAADAAKPETRTAAAYLGGDAGARLLDASGISHQRAEKLPDHGTVVLGADAVVDDAALTAFLDRGGQALVLPRAAADAPLGVKLVRADKHAGSLAVPAWASCRGLWPGDLRRRTDGPAWTIGSGADEVGADGLLAEVRRGDGVAVYCQLDAAALDADHVAYNRLTRWRWTRVLSQLAANLGIACAGDDQLLGRKTDKPASLYHPDYRTDFALGDDPVRYYRW